MMVPMKKTRKALSQLANDLLDAVNDLEACEASPVYRIDMGEWHVPRTAQNDEAV